MMEQFDRYLMQIKRHMKCPRKTKNILIKNYRDTIESFQNVSNMSLTDLYNKFDVPAVVAHNLTESISDSALKNYKIRKKAFYSFLIVITMAIAVIGTLFLSQKNADDKVIVDIKPSVVQSSA